MRHVGEDQSDGALLRAFRGGEAGAFGVLVERHQGVLLKHARSLLGAGGAWEDAVQEVFLRLVERPPDIPVEVAGDAARERAHLRSWLHKVTRNCCMDTRRAETRRRHREETVAAREEVAEAPSPLEQSDTVAAVERTLEDLPQDQREVLVLRLLGGRSYREIADITGRKVGTVGWLVSVGLRALGERLEPLLEGAPRPALAARDAAPSDLRLAQGES